MRVGLVGDTHVPEAALDLPREAYEALAGCDRILHCGDLHSIDVVDRLERLAPTMVARGNGDTYGARGGRPGVDDDPRVVDSLVFELDGFRVGMTHDLEHAEGRSDAAAAELLAKQFGGRVDIAVSGHTHVPMVWGLTDGTALVNPGSPTMPYGYLDVLGTVGYIDLSPGRFEISVVDLGTRSDQLVFVGPSAHQCTYGPRPTGGR
jgi:putative phosphoesterase